MTKLLRLQKEFLAQKNKLADLKIQRAQALKDKTAAALRSGDPAQALDAAKTRREAELRFADKEMEIALAEKKLLAVEEKFIIARLKRKKKLKILFLAANAVEGIQLSLDKELRAITKTVAGSALRNKIKIVSRWAVRESDILPIITDVKPDIAHFSGHGTQDGELLFEGKDGQPFPIKAHIVVRAILAASPDTRLCFFNACFSDADAQEIVKHIDAAVGMRTEIDDEAAIIFAARFYLAIGFGRSLSDAMKEARAELALRGIADEDTPILHVKDGFKPEHAVLLPISGED